MNEINILHKGDTVLSINDRFLAIKRKNGEVDIYNVVFSNDGNFLIDPIKSAKIGYGEGVVSKTLEDGETKLFTY